MQPDTTSESPGSDVTSTVFKDTELTLGLPGEARFSGGKTCSKRGFIETSMDLNLGDSSSSQTRGKILAGQDFSSESLVSGAGKPLAAKRQEVVGWPPVRSLRKRVLEGCKYVKVALDGAPYLRKVDLEIYNSYQELLRALEKMFMTCFAIHGNYVGEGERSKVMDPMKEMEYVPTYEDKDGDWMLVGDVPWKMFIESCKRIRLMKSSEAVGTLAPRTHPRSCTYEVAADQQLKAR